MPYVYIKYEKYYWIDQIELAYSQYFQCYNFKESWLDNRKHKSDSIMKYVRRRESKERTRSNRLYLLPSLFRLRLPPCSPCLSYLPHPPLFKLLNDSLTRGTRNSK